jgi:hypothetical protein
MVHTEHVKGGKSEAAAAMIPVVITILPQTTRV